MNFKLAGARTQNISFGCIQSLAYFFADFVYKHSKELKCENVVFSGDMFKNQSMSNLFYKHINPNNNIAFKELIKI
ncbi:hypothetical protein BFG04_02570 [Campylobacter pinnipediorum subsp. pinnipediorum]|uniref:Uncharacterized protein n=1 Tax=Campylobacter pinnipediorum subsp. pinnipediorum TaxID=1660067 RepID=A0AAX0LAE0_9BACT|nr:hypothetical protein [Campylobacter pinnipediorum]OPA78927.1 hypothetical protein BFG04_02570 [Campylobacter pinnipediorum subsp. pinnipediorum]